MNTMGCYESLESDKNVPITPPHKGAADAVKQQQQNNKVLLAGRRKQKTGRRKGMRGRVLYICRVY